MSTIQITDRKPMPTLFWIEIEHDGIISSCQSSKIRFEFELLQLPTVKPSLLHPKAFFKQPNK